VRRCSLVRVGEPYSTVELHRVDALESKRRLGGLRRASRFAYSWSRKLEALDAA